MEEQIEVNFRLDAEGRTAPAENTDACVPVVVVVGTNACVPDYTFKTVSTSLDVCPLLDPATVLDEILLDCEIADSGLLPRTFWISADGSARCQLEQMALDIFRHHVPQGMVYNVETSGAEWWVQIRPSPKMGRYSMLVQDTAINEPNDLQQSGISFHWDKDEDLRILCGGNTYVHPHLSTVTYLTDLGAPTMALNCRIHSLTGEYIVPDEISEAYISWPKVWKHLSFDGRYLHAAPSDLMEEKHFARQCQMPGDVEPGRLSLAQRRHCRVTFLVNIWLNYKPFNVQPFPKSMLDKLSGGRPGGDLHNLSLATTEEPYKTVDFANGDSTTDNAAMQTISWPLGDCDSGENISINLPLNAVREEAMGGNVRIVWKSSASSESKGVCIRADFV